MTKDELKKLARSKKYLALVHTLPCCITGMNCDTAHHIRVHTGMGQKSPDWFCIPLSDRYHQGRDGIHQIGTRAWEARYGSQLDHAKKTQALLSDLIDIPDPFRL